MSALFISGIGGCEAGMAKVLPIGGSAVMPFASSGIGIGLLEVRLSATISMSIVNPSDASPDWKLPPGSLVTLEICPVDGVLGWM